MTKNFLLLYELNKSSQNSRPFSLILKNRRICDFSQIFVNTFILKSMETSGNKTTSVFLMYNSLTYVDDLVFVSRWTLWFFKKKIGQLEVESPR